MWLIKWLVIWIVSAIIWYSIIMMLPERAEEYGPHPPTDHDRIAALEKALEDHEVALRKHEMEFHFYWKLINEEK